MGLFNFIKEVGHKIFDHANDTAQNDESIAQKLQQQIEKLNLGIDAPKVTVTGDKAVLEGKAISQDAMEKAILALGNTMGIAQVESRIETAQSATPTEQSKFYTVQKGDTLSKIAKENYGNANLYNTIFEANKPLLKNADDIFPGQQLRIPALEKKAA